MPKLKKNQMRHYSTLNVDVAHFARNVECDISSNFKQCDDGDDAN